MSKKTSDLYAVEATEDGAIIYLVNMSEISYLLDEDDIFGDPETSLNLLLDPDDAIEHFKVTTLAKIAHLRSEADFLMDSLKSIQPMEEL